MSTTGSSCSFVVRPLGRVLEAPDGLKPELPTQNGLKLELRTLTAQERLVHAQCLVSLAAFRRVRGDREHQDNLSVTGVTAA